MSGRVQLIYDDAEPVPTEVAAMTGVRSFGELLRRRERLSTTIRRLAVDAGLGEPVHARTSEALAEAADAARRHTDDDLYLVLPSHLAPMAAPRDAALFLRKLALFGEPVGLWRDDRPLAACLVTCDGLLDYVAACVAGHADRDRFIDEHAARVPSVQDALMLADLREVTAALEFLSGSFSARHFNQVTEDRYNVVKSSPDREKIRREYAFYGLLPEALQPYFLQPFGFRETAEGASYRMRRLFVPDLAVQWIHGVFSEAQFRQLTARVLHFVAERPKRDVDRHEAASHARELYVLKTRRRIEQLLAQPAGARVDEILGSGGVTGGVRGLLQRYEALYDSMADRRRERALYLSHGDLGFSNILYHLGTQDFQLIDPRGAATVDELFSDRLYDVAKLSHSVLGGYDFLVAGLFDVLHGDDLRLALRFDPAPPEDLRKLFAGELEHNGFDVDQVRLCEAALFLSMLPLHIDIPRRVVAFALVARDIMDELESSAR